MADNLSYDLFVAQPYTIILPRNYQHHCHGRRHHHQITTTTISNLPLIQNQSTGVHKRTRSSTQLRSGTSFPSGLKPIPTFTGPPPLPVTSTNNNTSTTTLLLQTLRHTRGI
jgi:hypothetical protein